MRKNPKLSGTTHNVFGIQVGVSISLLVKTGARKRNRRARIYYAKTGEDWRKEQKYRFLDDKRLLSGVHWEELEPDGQHTWLTAGLQIIGDWWTIPAGVAKNGLAHRVPLSRQVHALLGELRQWTVSFRQACMTAGEGGGYRRCPTKRQRRTADEARIPPSPRQPE